MSDIWDELSRPAPRSVVVDGIEVRRGTRVRLHPRDSADLFARALDGKTAVVEGIEQDMDDHIQLTVVADDDPGRDLGEMRMPGHRFFFAPEEVEPLQGARVHAAEGPALRVLHRRAPVGPQDVALVQHGVGDLPERVSHRRAACPRPAPR